MRIRSAGCLSVVVAMVVVMLLSLLPAGAASANISHSYRAESEIREGSLVSLDPDRSDYVVQANTDNADRLLGVVVEQADSLLAVDPGEGQVQVATNGTANVLVTTLGGDIKVGDSIATSPFNGMGTKAQSGDRIIGLAQTAFNKDTEGVLEQEVTDTKGNKQTVYVGFVRVTVSVGSLESNNDSLSGLQKLGHNITGRTVSTVRVVIAMVIAVVSVAALIVLAYAAIYGTIVSIGRNPLAKYAIFRTLGTVLGMVTIIALVAGVAIYLLLV